MTLNAAIDGRAVGTGRGPTDIGAVSVSACCVQSCRRGAPGHVLKCQVSPTACHGVYNGLLTERSRWGVCR